MKIQQFLEHYGITENPFGQEDAQSDHVFRQYCLESTHHPAWDKIFGRPENPSTAVLFGEKGSGKTALRLQMIAHLQEYNEQHPQSQIFIIEYDDFNPYLDNFRERLPNRHRKPEKALSHFRLWDHMDAILSLGTRRLVKAILERAKRTKESGEMTLTRDQTNQLTALQRRDVLLLAAFYDHQLDQPPLQRWNDLRRKLDFRTWKSYKELGIGIAGSLVLSSLILKFGEWSTFLSWWAIVLFILLWFPWVKRQATLLKRAFGVGKQIRVYDTIPNTLRRILSRFPKDELDGQPMPDRDRSDDRYELLVKFQGLLKTLGYEHIVVLVDRVDEPHLINGVPERMRDLIWPMFDNKFLQHPRICFKMLLPLEVVYFLNREEKSFYDRSRLDKQNLITSLDWTGESLYDIANARLAACFNPNLEGAPSAPPKLAEFFEGQISEEELMGMFARMRVPRHLFKFLYRVLVDHCNRYSDSNPDWTINRDTLQSVLAVYMRDLEAFDRGMGTG